jgi:hypothetical protein
MVTSAFLHMGTMSYLEDSPQKLMKEPISLQTVPVLIHQAPKTERSRVKRVVAA